tara:strand:- start:215 stop:508 length:294 start_codon:yes stop_codon:yes gene_type:complete
MNLWSNDMRPIHSEAFKQKVCGLFKEGYTTKQVAKLANITVGSAIGIKYRAKMCAFTIHLQGIQKEFKFTDSNQKKFGMDKLTQHELSVERLKRALL